MKLPRDVSGVELVRALKVLGYLESRQSGSHHVTIPKHDHLKLGTMKSILDDVAEHHGINRTELLRLLRL